MGFELHIRVVCEPALPVFLMAEYFEYFPADLPRLCTQPHQDIGGGARPNFAQRK